MTKNLCSFTPGRSSKGRANERRRCPGLIQDALSGRNPLYRRLSIAPFVGGGGVNIRIIAALLAGRVFQQCRAIDPRALLLGRVPPEEFVPPIVVVDQRGQGILREAPRAFLVSSPGDIVPDDASRSTPCTASSEARSETNGARQPMLSVMQTPGSHVPQCATLVGR